MVAIIQKKYLEKSPIKEKMPQVHCYIKTFFELQETPYFHNFTLQDSIILI